MCQVYLKYFFTISHNMFSIYSRCLHISSSAITFHVRLQQLFVRHRVKLSMFSNVHNIPYTPKINPLSFGLLAGCCFSKQGSNSAGDPILLGHAMGTESKTSYGCNDACEGLLNQTIESASTSHSLNSGITGDLSSDALHVDNKNRSSAVNANHGLDHDMPESQRTMSSNDVASKSSGFKSPVSLKRSSGEILDDSKSKYQKFEIRENLHSENSISRSVPEETSSFICNDTEASILPVVADRDGRNRDALKDKASSSKRSERKQKQRPNYFVSMKISNPVIHKSLESVQEQIVEKDPRLKSAVVPLKKLHLTLMVMYLSTDDEHKKALEVLNCVHEHLKQDFCKNPLVLEFTGLGTFNGKVIFAKVKPGDPLDRLNDIAEDVIKRYEEASIFSTDLRGFNSHLTVMKLSRNHKLLREVKKIDPSLYTCYQDQVFGSEVIQSIELLKMSGEDASGYYKGHHLFFEVDHPCAVVSPSVSLTQEIQNEKDKITKLAQQQLKRMVISSSDKTASASSSTGVDTEANKK